MIVLLTQKTAYEMRISDWSSDVCSSDQAAVRLIRAKIKDRDIELRTAGQVPEDDALVTDVLQKMVKQRRESIAMYEQGGRAELAAKEQAELDVIEGFLPTQMSEDETRTAGEATK